MPKASMEVSRRASRRKFCADEKIRIILKGLNSAQSISELCRVESIAPTVYYRWRKKFVDWGRKGLTHNQHPATSSERMRALTEEIERLKTSAAEMTLDLKFYTRPGIAKLAKHPRLTPEQKLEVIRAVESSEFPAKTSLARLHVSRSTYYRWRKNFRCQGQVGLRPREREKSKKSNDETIRSAVFSILHSPPSSRGYNRTTWKMDDLWLCLREEGHPISKHVIKDIISSAGYRWRKAKVVLTSPDPEYRDKLETIQLILSTLGEDERFFSIDEFGPFAVKMKGGKKLTAPGEYPWVPQYQKSKGCLILTAALELSRNQVTHFYSKKKNTAEMLKLLGILLDRYGDCRKLYLSWDAASWHVSKELNQTIAEINHLVESGSRCPPFVETAPLPSSAQFLNVIESVFSGMARAIIHNSNYQSVDEVCDAIDQYFKDRNAHFLENPKKAGKKIWGKEIVPSNFAEGQNCKDPRW